MRPVLKVTRALIDDDDPRVKSEAFIATNIVRYLVEQELLLAGIYDYDIRVRHIIGETNEYEFSVEVVAA